MKESHYKSYDDLPLFLNAKTVAKVLGVSWQTDNANSINVSTVAVTPLVLAPIRSVPIRRGTDREAASPTGEFACSVTAITALPALVS